MLTRSQTRAQTSNTTVLRECPNINISGYITRSTSAAIANYNSSFIERAQQRIQACDNTSGYNTRSKNININTLSHSRNILYDCNH